MYSKLDYLRRGMRFVNNKLRPGHKTLSTLMFYGTDLCDSGCKHCLIWAKRPVKHLPMEKIIEVMKSKCVTKHTTVGLEGGEFLLHPEAMEILKWFKENHPNFDLLSNCLKPENVIEAVKKYPPKRLYISLDGTKDTYLYMRGKDGYDNVLRVVKECKDLVPISLMFTLSPYNSFDDMEHVIEVAKKNNIDVRIGTYNDIAFFDTVEKAHETEIGAIKNTEVLTYGTVRKAKQEGLWDKNAVLNVLEQEEIATPKHDHTKVADSKTFKQSIPWNIEDTTENYDFLLLYDEWRKKKTNLKCYSILDSIVIHPDGAVPICQNLDLKLGNVNTNTLDNIFNSLATQKVQKEHVDNCNQCWINFHRKYDIVMMRTLEKGLPKWLIEKIFGDYQWTDNKKVTYKEFMEQNRRA
ncbi:MAG TPA: radical SAM protein [Ferruginibacter sp.]|jgi:MoaA/NifB/PqqE/SkfB family radical SAM enzyme|nr:radical SAM protein [Ferruginibacter sp.]